MEGKDGLCALHKRLKPDIEERLKEFTQLWERGGDGAIFREMCFCMCTPQNNAHKAWDAVCSLDGLGLLTGDAPAEEIAPVLRERGVRFHNNKAASIVKNRAVYYPHTKKKISAIIGKEGVTGARGALARDVAGWGLKEASHFLRNTGHGERLAILDRHILRCLVSEGVIERLPDNMPKNVYLDIEKRLLDFARESGLPAVTLDMLFWFKETGELFK